MVIAIRQFMTSCNHNLVNRKAKGHVEYIPPVTIIWLTVKLKDMLNI